MDFIENNPGLYNFEEYRIILDHINKDAVNQDGPAHKQYLEHVQKLKDYFIRHRS